MLYARRKGWTVDRVEVRLRHDKRESPAGKADFIDLELLLGGGLTTEQKSRLAEIAERCPVHRALRGEVVITETRRG